jgi:hypothetical protein
MHEVTVNKVTYGISNFECLCGETKGFDRPIDAAYAGERHARKTGAAVVFVQNGCSTENASTDAKPMRMRGVSSLYQLKDRSNG